MDLDETFIDKFSGDIEELLDGSNAIVIASPDVNPVTEYLLHKIYNLNDNLKPFTECESYAFGWHGIQEKDKKRLKEFLAQRFDIDWVKTAEIGKIDNTIKVSTEKNSILLKLNDKETEVILEIDGGRNDKFMTKLESDELNIYCRPKNFKGLVAVKRRETISEKKIRRLFYREEASKGKKESRGFIVYYHDTETGDQKDKGYFENYKSQIDIGESPEGFELLGHLVVAKYPKNSDNLIVLLNGLSGPATFALSQILTGSGKTTETMLQRLNELLDEKNCKGVQAIIQVSITKAADPNLTYVDSRIADRDSLKFHADYVRKIE